MGEVTPGIFDLGRIQGPIPPVRSVIEAKRLGMALRQDRLNTAFSVPGERRRQKHVEKTVHQGSWSIGRVRQGMNGPHRMMKAGCRLERQPSLRTGYNERCHLFYWWNRLRRHAAGPNFRKAAGPLDLAKVRYRDFTVNRPCGLENALAFQNGGTRFVRIPENRQRAIQIPGQPCEFAGRDYQPTQHPGKLAATVLLIVLYRRRAGQGSRRKQPCIID
jgi:hypothetical protein